MKLTKVVPKMDETFGKLTFAGTGEVNTTGYGRNVRVVSRNYNLFSSVQRADDIVVIVTGNTLEKTFSFEEEVKLINPVITAEGRNIQGSGFTNYLLYADDIVPASEVMDK